MAEQNELKLLDLDAMFDTKMDEVETLPDFVNPPAGNYLLSVHDCDIKKYKTKPKDGKPAQDMASINLTYKVDQTIETKDIPVKDGALFSERFTATEEGLKYFKKQAMNILGVESFEGASLKDVMEGVKGTQFNAQVTVVKSGEYENVRVRPYQVA
jgi:hypothetical protein